MAVELLNCLSQRDTNKIITDCCCLMNCDLTNTYSFAIRILDLAMSAGDFSISNIFIDGNPLSYPIDIGSGASVVLSFSLCAPSTEEIGQLAVDIEVQGIGTDSYTWDLESIAPSSFISPTSLNFGNVAVGNGSFLYINVPDTLLCCNDFYVSTLTSPFAHADGVSICPQSGPQQIMVSFSPTETGLATQDLTISINECNSIVIPLTGNGIEPPSGGNTPPQKNKVDQTTRVEACSPRTVNNRCQTARTIQSAIRSNARRFGKR